MGARAAPEMSSRVLSVWSAAHSSRPSSLPCSCFRQLPANALDVVPPSQLCDGSVTSVTFKGDLTFDSTGNGGRQDVGMWLGEFNPPGGQCRVYGFQCDGTEFDLENYDDDICADVQQGLTKFKGIEFTVPCEGNEAGELVVPYCVSAKTSGQDIEECKTTDDIFPGPDSKCKCPEAPLVISALKVCPDLETISVTPSLVGDVCVGDGSDFLLTFENIPTAAGVSYTIAAKDGSLNIVDIDGDLDGTTATENLYPTIEYDIELAIAFENDKPDCGTVTLGLNPTCSCGESGCPDGLICCEKKDYCDVFGDESVDGVICGDPHMTGFLGQKFDFTGEDGGWYSVIADSNMNVNMRVTSPVADLPEITYITGLSVLTTDTDGLEHSIVIEVIDPHNLDSSCPAGVSPCLGDGALVVLLDGVESLFAPGTVALGADVEVSAANLPGACRSFGFEKYWERKKLENARAGRLLRTTPSMGEWILGDPTATNMNECVEYVARAEAEEGGVFAHQSEHVSFQIVTPKATVRLSHGRLHQIAMRDPTDRFDLPDHLTWQMNMAIHHEDVSHAAKGILGQTFVPTRDADGKPIMTGLEAIRGSEEDYRVDGALGVDFVQDAHTS
ncbi:unnamed protein product [Ectocarpus sp. CCAP 1310/34]|nr:unnamed protein product [Ectocarpus sp. CCAP 1310/34]